MTCLRLTHSRAGRYLAIHVMFGKSRFMWMPGRSCPPTDFSRHRPGCTMAMLDAEGHPRINRNDRGKPLAGSQSKLLQ